MDRVQLHQQFGKQPRRRWRDRSLIAPNATTVNVGRLADGRWYAELSCDHDGAYVFGDTEQDEALAVRLAYRWMRESGRRWWATPARLGGDGKPADGLPWVKRDGEWVVRK